MRVQDDDDGTTPPGGIRLFCDIHNDVKRTHGSLSFFQADKSHLTALFNILAVFGLLNPGVGYVQGMNELLAPIYLVLAREGRARDRDFVPLFIGFDSLVSRSVIM
jgi:hypothetical protein